MPCIDLIEGVAVLALRLVAVWMPVGCELPQSIHPGCDSFEVVWVPAGPVLTEVVNCHARQDLAYEQCVAQAVRFPGLAVDPDLPVSARILGG
jgi:hypothetical protein